MTTKFSIENRYPKSADVVIRMFTDRSYFERKYQAMEVADFAVVEHVTGEHFSIGVRFRAAGQTRVPDFAKKLIGDAIKVQQTDRWEVSKRVGSIDIEIAGAPATVHADMKLQPVDARSCVLKLDWQIRCGIPLLGGKVEKVIAEDVQRRAAEDEKVSIKLLKDYA